MKIIGVIRSLGERTEEIAIAELKKQVDEVFLVRDVKPFYKTVIKCIDIALEQNADYMITNDADVIIKEGAVKILVKHIKKTNSPLVTGHTISKFLGRRQGGVRIWSNKKLTEIKKFIEKNGEVIRPEADIHKKFKGSLINDVTSTHEYNQFYRDIYDRFVKHGIKHKSLANIIKNFKNSKDLDFKVAYHGYFDKEKNFKKSFPNLLEKEEILENKKI